MTLSIRDSILDNVVKEGIRVARNALQQWLKELAEAGLLRGLVGAVLGSLFGATAEGQAGGIGTSDITRAQHGGIVRRPTLLLAGEAGPEEIVPLSAGGGGPGVVVNIFPPSGTTVEERDQRGPNGETIKNIFIRMLRQGLQTGELDRDFGTAYGVRRVGLQR